MLDRSQQPPNPAPAWISDEAWDDVTSLSSLPGLKGLAESVAAAPGEWEAWFRAPEPEAGELPAEWEARASELQRLLLVRCMRPDRVLFAATAFGERWQGRARSWDGGAVWGWAASAEQRVWGRRPLWKAKAVG